MNALTGEALIDPVALKNEIEARDREIANAFTKDSQVMGIHSARRYLGDRLIRTAKPHRLLDPAHGPLIAVRLNILTRKSLGGFETDPRAGCLEWKARSFLAFMPWGRQPGSGAAVCMGIARLRAHFSAAACSQDGKRAALRRRQCKKDFFL